MYCKNCGMLCAENATFCSNCGTRLKSTYDPYAYDQASNRDWLITLLFCVLLGYLGAHRFYVGKIGTGILMLITFGGLGIWVLIDLIYIIMGKFRDERGKVIQHW